MNTRRFGIIGEKIAQGYLLKNGYEIIETNFYTKKGEIDIRLSTLEKLAIGLEIDLYELLDFNNN